MLPLIVGGSLLAGCKDSGRGGATAAPTPAPELHWGRPAGTAPGVNVALTYIDRTSADVYRVDRQRRAARVLHYEVDSPGDQIDAVTLSSGESPTACMIVGLAQEHYRLVIRCVNAAGPLPAPPPGVAVEDLQISPDGTRLLATDAAKATNHVMHELVLDGARWRELRTIDLTAFEKAVPGCEVSRVRRTDATSSVVRCRRPDAGDRLFREPFEQLAKGGLSSQVSPLSPKGSRAKGFGQIDELAVLDNGEAFGVISSPTCGEELCTGQKGSRVVLLDPTTGEVLQVVGSPLPQRQLTYVGGDAHGIVYMTESADSLYSDQRLYVRWPGEAKGQRVTGVPSDFEWMFAEG